MAFWVTFGLIGVIQALLLKAMVPLLARSAENAWDNAAAYAIVSGLLVYFPVRWMVAADGWTLTVLAFAVLWAGQTAALRVYYSENIVAPTAAMARASRGETRGMPESRGDSRSQSRSEVRDARKSRSWDGGYAH